MLMVLKGVWYRIDKTSLWPENTELMNNEQ